VLLAEVREGAYNGRLEALPADFEVRGLTTLKW
jgi:hypothetical protein